MIQLSEILGIGSFIGAKAILDIENILIEYQYTNGTCPKFVDFTNLSVRESMIEPIAELQFKYGSEVTGLSGYETEIDRMLDTGYFIKKNLGRIEYAKKFSELIVNSDYPLMINDKIGVSSKHAQEVTLFIVQPLMLTSDTFYYNELKPMYTQPKPLERALQSGSNIWTPQSMFISDIGNLSSGFRFAKNLEERGIMDILKSVIENRLSGFI